MAVLAQVGLQWPIRNLVDTASMPLPNAVHVQFAGHGRGSA